MNNENYPQYPLYIVSKGRSDSMFTSRALTRMGVRHNIVVEQQDIVKYNEAIHRWNLLATLIELDMSYKEKYETCDTFGLTKSTGPGPARNFAWDHSIKLGYKWHWVMDDNIRHFRRLNNNERVKVTTGAIFKAMEDFCMRYKNVGMAGPNYVAFCPRRHKFKPFIKNTRIYSCNLIRNDVPLRWRGRYNEDTILSLDMLTNKWCTIQFYCFLQEKMLTQMLKGGNTTEFYHAEGKIIPGQKYADKGTLAKSQMQVKVYPHISKLIWRYNRWHHFVDYTVFKDLQLIKNENFKPQNEINNYGMKLIEQANE